METGAKMILTFLEKLTNFSFILLLFSLTLFTDFYLIQKYNISVLQVEKEWLSVHTTSSEILQFVLWLWLFYTFFTPILSVIATRIALEICRFFEWIGSFFMRPSIPSRRFMSLSALRDFAIENNNSVAYKEYEKRVKSRKIIEEIQERYVSIIALLLAPYVPYLPFGHAEIKAFPWHMPWPLGLCLLPVL